MIYLDANATEPLRPEAQAALLEAASHPGNPSSVHAAGRAARARLESARRVLATRFGARAEDIIFTSGGTEACTLAVTGLRQGRPLLVGATEHPAVLAAAPDASTLPVHADGTLAIEALEAALAETGPALVCLMVANNETGVLHPLAEAAATCRRHGATLFADASQAAGRAEFTLASLGADAIAVSAHKAGGPPGAGALICAPGIAPEPLLPGGGQERGRRGGTPALPAVAAMAAAFAIRPDPCRLAALRDAVEAAAREAGARVCGAGPRLPNTTCLALPGVSAATQLMHLDLAGIAVSAGSACSSGRIAESHVLLAMGLGPLAGQAIRVSLPWNATAEDVEAFVHAYRAMAAALRR